MSSTEPSERRRALRFGAGALIALCGIGLWVGIRKHHSLVGIVSGVTGILMLALAIVAPSVVLTIRRGWMAIAVVLGWVNTRILLSVIFFGVITPMALVRELLGADPLQLRWKPGGRASYWRVREEEYDASHYEHQS